MVTGKNGKEKKRYGRRIARSKRAGREDSTRPSNFNAVKSLARLRQVLNPQQIEIVVWYYFEGHTMPDIGELLNCSKKAVQDRLAVIERRLLKAKIPMPKRTEHPYATDHVSNYNLT